MFDLTALLDRLSGSFRPIDLDRGIDYAESNRVRLDWDVDSLAARVSGSATYRVVLDRRSEQNGWRLGAGCTCPRFRKGHPCKHIVASLVAANELDLFDELGWDLEHLSDVERVESAPAEEIWQRIHESNRAGALDARKRLHALERELENQRHHPRPAFDVLQKNGDWLIWLVVDVESWSYGDLAFDTYRQKPRRDGSLGKLSKMPMRADRLERYRGDVDRELLQLMLPLQSGFFERPESNGEHPPSSTRLFLPTQLALAILPPLLETGRVLVEGSDRERRVLRWDDGAPFELRVQIDDDPTTVTGSFVRGEQERKAEHALAARRLPMGLFSDRDATNALVLFPDSIARAHLTVRDDPWLEVLVGKPPLRLGASDRHRLINMLRQSPTPELEAPPDFRFETRTVQPKPVVEVAIAKREQDDAGNWSSEINLEIKPLFDYGTLTLSPSDRRSLWLAPDGRSRLARDTDAEVEWLDRLLDTETLERRRIKPTFPTGDNPDPPLVYLAPLEDSPAAALRSLCRELGEEWTVYFDAQPVEIATDIEARVESGVDWFELEAAVRFKEGEVPLPALLAALRKGEGVVALPSGAIGLVPEAWLRPLETMTHFGSPSESRIRLEASQLLFFDQLLETQLGMDVQFDRQAKRLVERLRDFESIAVSPVPVGFRGELRHYQQVGVGWLEFLREYGLGGCLADDMGLGKTIQVIALLLETRKSAELPSLVVAPRSVIENWVREVEAFGPEITTLRYWGPKRKQTLSELTDHDLVVTTYGTLRRDIEELGKIAWDTVILDEAQAIKNAHSKTARAARRLLARQRLALTGTPVENHLGELASIFEFLNPGMTGLDALRGLKKRDLDASLELAHGDSELALASKALRPLILRRTKEAVLDDLPPKTEATLFCELGPKQRHAYRELLEYYQDAVLSSIDERGLGRSKIHVLEALLRLRQAACHPGLVDKTQARSPSAKFDVLLDNLESCLESNHKALVFSQFTSLLALLRPLLDARGYDHLYLDGKTRQRQELVDRFQNEADPKLFLISLRAGGLGLNLTAADYVFVLDPWWNPAVEAQAIDRAHRIGQTRSVFAYRLLAKDTVEERIAQLQEKKKALSDAILGEDKSLMERLTREDIELLLS